MTKLYSYPVTEAAKMAKAVASRSLGPRRVNGGDDAEGARQRRLAGARAGRDAAVGQLERRALAVAAPAPPQERRRRGCHGARVDRGATVPPPAPNRDCGRPPRRRRPRRGIRAG